MSLINDQLKKAKNDRPQEAGYALNPLRRPLDPVKPKRSVGFYLMPVGLAILLAGAGWLIWQGLKTGAEEQKVRANEAQPAAPAPTETPRPAPDAVPANPTVTPAPAAAATPTSKAPAVDTPEPTPVTYNLQGLVYKGKDSSAVINGKTVFIGEHVGGAKVIAIDRDTVTLQLPNGKMSILELQ